MIHVDIYSSASLLEDSFFTLDDALDYIRNVYNSDIQNINIYEDTRIADCYGHS